MSDDQRQVVTTLTPKQVRFLEHYLVCWNATEAARVAKYKHPNQQGPNLLKNAQIAAAIRERLETAAMSADEVLARLSQQAGAEYSPYIKVTQESDGSNRPYVDAEALIADGKAHLIKGIKIGQYGINIEFHDVQAALVILARHHRLLTDQVDVTTKGQAIKGYANVSPDDWDDEPDAAASGPGN